MLETRFAFGTEESRTRCQGNPGYVTARLSTALLRLNQPASRGNSITIMIKYSCELVPDLFLFGR